MVLVVSSYVEPDTSTQAAAILSNTKADTLLPEAAGKLAPAAIARATGTANVVPAGPSSKTGLINAAPVMPRRHCMKIFRYFRFAQQFPCSYQLRKRAEDIPLRLQL